MITTIPAFVAKVYDDMQMPSTPRDRFMAAVVPALRTAVATAPDLSALGIDRMPQGMVAGEEATYDVVFLTLALGVLAHAARQLADR